ncbi:type I-E CRISPR-associated protein Cse2/CasB [Streptomyces sp. NPDC086519]|uniref:type I-E CRISPR-associated protein Cse2/CasB n=1 Tax=Streptomyces sp. NPDC086519 TaxID=3154863 RepID=UPI00341306C4
MTTTVALPTVRDRVSATAHSLIVIRQKGYLRDVPKDVAALARLRRGAGRSAGEVPDLWDLIDTGRLHQTVEGQQPLNEGALGRAEEAVHASLTLWALHQQSRGGSMHRPTERMRPTGLGASVRRLMPVGEIDEPVRKRLVRAGTAPDLATLAQRLRDLVVLLRGADIPLDYGLLAGQLYTWQWPDGPSSVRREWGRSFHARPSAAGQDAPLADTTSLPDTDKDAS